MLSQETNAANTIQVVKQELGAITVKIDLTAAPRQIERQLARVVKPFRCPKDPQVRQGVNLMAMNPTMTAAEAASRVGHERLTRRIQYWASKLLQGGVR